jgi:hypothetical protein
MTFERFRIGRRVRVARAISYTGATKIAQGELGTVRLNDADIGQIHIRLDHPHPNLADADNCIFIIPPDRDVSDAIELLDAA